MAIDVLLVKEGTRLAAADPVSWDAIQKIKDGQTVTAAIRRSRNPRHHAKLFALLQVVFEHQNQFATIPDLLNALKLATGYFDIGNTVDNIPYCIPKSISFASMDQTSFEQFYEKVIAVILTKIVPGIERDDIESRVHEILDGNTQTNQRSNQCRSA